MISERLTVGMNEVSGIQQVISLNVIGIDIKYSDWEIILFRRNSL